MQRVSRILLAEQYTGANGAAVLTMCQSITQFSGNEWAIHSDTGEELVLRESSPVMSSVGFWPIKVGTWVLCAPDTGIVARISAAQYAARYRTIDDIVSAAVADNVAVIAASAPVQNAIIAEVGKAMYGGFGVTTMPLLLVGATSSPLPVTILPTQPDTGYVARAFAVSGAAVLTTLEIVSITKTNGSVATVVVKNNGVASVGGLLLVHVTSPVGGASAPRK